MPMPGSYKFRVFGTPYTSESLHGSRLCHLGGLSSRCSLGTPQVDELKAPFRELVVTGRGQMAARAHCGRTLTQPYGHFDTLFVGAEFRVLVDKTREPPAFSSSGVRPSPHQSFVISSMERKRAAGALP